MKAVGATNRQVLLSVLTEAVTISVAGAVVGVALSFGGASYLNMMLPQAIAIVSPRVVAQGILFAAFIGMVSGILPANGRNRLGSQCFPLQQRP